MQGLNKVMLIGHLGKDPEYVTLETGTTRAKCSLATSESYKDKEGKLQTQTEWHSLILWQTLADYAHKYLKKGNLVYVEGKIKTRSFEDKDRIKRYATEIIGERMTKLDKASVGVSPEPATSTDVENDTNLPF